MEREPPRRRTTEAEDLFLKTYGIPLSWAKQLAQFDNDAGRHWRGILDFLSKPKNEHQEHIIYVRPKIKRPK